MKTGTNWPRVTTITLFEALGMSWPMSSPTSALISATVTPFRWGHLSTSSWGRGGRGLLELVGATGSLGVENTRGSSMKLSSSKSKTSNWTSSHFLVLLSLSIVVNEGIFVYSGVASFGSHFYSHYR